MANDSRPERCRHASTRLQGTLFCGDRLFPVTLVDLSEQGFVAEGAGLDRLGDEFLLDITLPGVLGSEWSPKATGASPRGPGASQLRLAARLQAKDPPAGGLVTSLTAAFIALSDDALTSVRRWLAREAVGGQPITKGVGPRISPP